MSEQPTLEENAKRAKHIMADQLIDSNDKLGSYENGWGFFTEHTLLPSEFQVTSNDDYLVDIFLGEKSKPQLEHGPLPLDKRRVAEEGVRRLFATVWGIKDEGLKNVIEARERLYELEQPDNKNLRDKLYSSGKHIHYQVGQTGRVKYHEQFKNDWYGQFLHFGTPAVPTNTPEEDKLDTWMRVYIGSKPEYAADIASELVKRMRDDHNKDIYGKIHDISSAENPNTPIREDNLLLYLGTHSQMVAAATVLKSLVDEMPEKFKKSTDYLNRARKTDIPFVSIGEEPVQVGSIQESFNSIRENIEATAQDTFAGMIADRTGIDPNTKIEQVFQYIYQNGIKTKAELREGYRIVVKSEAIKHGVSDTNYALNIR